MTTTKPNKMDEYIAEFPKDKQIFLEQIRATIKKNSTRGRRSNKIYHADFHSGR